MKTTIQARLDQNSLQALKKLERVLGYNTSEVVREALERFVASLSIKPKRKFIGLGKFKSGVPDLASNKKHLKGFGS